ncbi:MAG: hypothetical protein K5886_12655 [Lachnospiraceae bacterium]|nr:hypothetical protein [Lachnospiraceae bacterium]
MVGNEECPWTMILYYEKLLLTDKTKKNIDKLKESIENAEGLILTGTYVLELAANEKDVFDLIPIQMFKFRAFRKRDHLIIGFAESKRACYSLVEEIISEHYKVTGRYDSLRSDLERIIRGFELSE